MFGDFTAKLREGVHAASKALGGEVVPLPGDADLVLALAFPGAWLGNQKAVAVVTLALAGGELLAGSSGGPSLFETFEQGVAKAAALSAARAVTGKAG